MTEKDPLETCFDAAREAAPEPSVELLARIAADAEAEQAARAPVVAATGGRWRAVLRGIGGWPAVAGFATATVAGIYIGLAQPLGVDPFAFAGLGFDETALSIGYADIGWDEG